MWGLGFWDLLILAFVLLLIFGTKRMPQMGRSLGGSIRGFKDAVTDRVDKQDAEAEAEAAQLPPAPPVAAQQPVEQRERDTVTRERMRTVLSADWVLPVAGTADPRGAVAIEDGRIAAVGTQDRARPRASATTARRSCPAS